jgi:hypothetical protein
MMRTLVRGAMGLALALSLAGCAHGGHGGNLNTGHIGGGHSYGGHSSGGHSSGGYSGHSYGGHSSGSSTSGSSHRDGHPHGTPDWGHLGSHGTAMGSGPNPGDAEPAYFGEFTCAAKRQEWMTVHQGFGRVPPQLRCAPDGSFGSPVVYGPQQLAGAGPEPD